MHMMIREIIPGSQQRIRRCPLSNVTVAGILIKSVKVPAALTLAEVIDLAETVDWRWLMACLHGAIVAAIGRATDRRDDRTV